MSRQATARRTYDVIMLAVRVAAVASRIDDISAGVGDKTTIVPVLNGMAHLDALVHRYGVLRVSGGAARMTVSMRDDRWWFTQDPQRGAAAIKRFWTDVGEQ